MLYQWLSRSLSAYDVKGHDALRQLLFDELLKHPTHFGIKAPKKGWRRKMTIRHLSKWVPPVEVILVCSYVFDVKIEVFYWNVDLISFVDLRRKPLKTISLQCEGGFH